MPKMRRDAAKLAIEDELAALKAEVEGFNRLTSGSRVHLGASPRRLRGAEGPRELYRTVLQVHVTDLDSTLAALTTNVESLLNQKAAA